jgi:hypothetical protein
MRTMPVIVPRVLGQHFPQVPFAEEQQVVQALAAKCSHEPLRERVCSRRPDRRLDHPRAVPGEDVVKCRGELAVPVADQELEPVPPEYSIAWLICAVTCGLEAVMVGLAGCRSRSSTCWFAL